ncbi:uncharacterized protein LOC142769155 isoform X2 [Rhipicephalus microplus]|uniref:uncharacterized protein LOC142769155 isoform X2 n=1 Tax=Rhipicephalus microplus TaxID=6941 RepID=UPI003F6A6129
MLVRRGRGPRQAPGGFVNLAYDPSGPTRRSPSPGRRSPPTSPPQPPHRQQTPFGNARRDMRRLQRRIRYTYFKTS